MTFPSGFEQLVAAWVGDWTAPDGERPRPGVESILAAAGRHVDASCGWIAIRPVPLVPRWQIVSQWAASTPHGRQPPLAVIEALARLLGGAGHLEVLGPEDVKHLLRQAGASPECCDHGIVAVQVSDAEALAVQLVVCPREPADPSPKKLEAVRLAGVAAASALRQQAQDERFRIGYRALHQTAEMVIVTDREERILWVNPAFEKFTGYTLGDIMGQTPRVLRSGAHDSAFYDDLRGRIRRAEAFRGEIVNRKRNGDLYVEEKIISPVRDEHGALTHFVSTGRDVTQRRQLDEALRASERSLRQAQQIAGLGSWEWLPTEGHEGTVRWSEQTRRIFGLPDDQPEPSFQSFLQHVPLEHRQRVTAAFDEALRTGRPIHVDHRLRALDSVERFVEVRAEVERNAEGRTVRVLGTVRDVSAEHHAEARRKELQLELNRRAIEWQQTFDAFDFPVLVVEATGEIHRLNRAARDLIGGSYRDALGRRIETIRGEEPWESAAKLAASIAAGGPPDTLRRHRISTGQTWEIAGRSMGNGGSRWVLLVLRDITDTVRLEESLRRADLLAKMGTLVAGVAHEVRNPLFGISATLDAFESRFGSQEAFAPFFDVLRGELDRLSALMQDLLDYGKPLSDERVSASLARVAERVAVALTADADRRRIQLKLDDQGLAAIRIDARRIELAIRNLVANAIEHAPPESTIRIIVAQAPPADGHWATVTVSDEGPGFSSDQLVRLPEPFLSGRPGGTGLGLAIVSRIAEEHQGRLRLWNRSGGGACACLALPLGEEER
jgi:PAS domain S-box-containing protein